jgi:molecular chaperone HscB
LAARYSKAAAWAYLCAMDYFELFGIPQALVTDKSRLAKRYFELQKQYHPDFYTGASEAEKAGALEKSALINQALKTLQNTDATMAYVLQQKGVLEAEEKYALPPDFLMEMMELNEALADSGTEAEARLAAAESEIYEGVKHIVENYDAAATTGAELLLVKEYYYKKKYLQRIRERIRNIAAQNG